MYSKYLFSNHPISEKVAFHSFIVFIKAALASNMNNPPDRSLSKTDFNRTSDFLTHPVFSR